MSRLDRFNRQPTVIEAIMARLVCLYRYITRQKIIVTWGRNTINV